LEHAPFDLLLANCLIYLSFTLLRNVVLFTSLTNLPNCIRMQSFLFIYVDVEPLQVGWS